MLIACIEHPDFAARDLSSLRAVCSGGTTVPAELVRRIEQTLGVHFSIFYGQTEASPGVTQTLPDDSPEDKADTLGPPLPQTEVKIVDPATGETVPLGVVGRALHARLPGHARILRDAGEDRGGDRRRRLAPHRRPGARWTIAATPGSPADSRT